jgi:MoaA/NifB/PqqE/SkfB family radical SAM enzyme
MRIHLVKDLQGIKLLTIYLGDQCNFDCTYCDRGYIKSLGGQSLNAKTRDDMRDFFWWVAGTDNEIERISFHGGEPLLFIKRMDEIMDWLYPLARQFGWKLSFTSNGSLVKENEWFFEKYSGVFAATISFDFMFQAMNREVFNVGEMAEVLNKHCDHWLWQYVLPIDHPAAFSFDNLKNIVHWCYETNCKVVNIIPLRHKRGKDKFDVIIDRLDLKQFYEAFLQFIQILYIKKLTVFIDGNYDKIDKAYFAEHQKAVLSPDGYLYPEFDFLEYKIEDARIGNWRTKELWQNKGDEGRILDSCLSCEKRPSCGLKYLYHLFDETPQGACKDFYTYLDWAIMHNNALHQDKTLLHHIGFENVEINS